jgi:hypothetical protein
LERNTVAFVRKIVAKMGIVLKSKTELRNAEKLVVFAGIYSKSLKRFIEDYSSRIYLVVIFLAPKKEHFLNMDIIYPKKIKILISRDSLEPLSEAKRKIMIKQE